jgi:hypothetical protein
VAPDPLFERLRRALLPDYELERELASGGMGIVYVAHDVTLNVNVAVKIIRPGLETAHAIEAFHREARIIARIDHPNVVKIHISRERHGFHYYIMDLVGGPTLAQRLEAGGKLPLEDAVRVGKDLLAGLGAVHRTGIVHRDVKPSNVFLLPERALLADFGISRPPSGEPRAPGNRPMHAGEGTRGYQAPEQIDGSPVTNRTDLYSAGAVVYEAITGRRHPQLGEVPSWEDVPDRIAGVLQRALRPAPADRWPDARTFHDALREAYVPPRVPRPASVAMIAVALAIAIYIIIARPPPHCGGTVTVALPRFEYVGPPAYRAIADSLPLLVRAHLGSHPDFCLTASRRAPSRAAGGLVITGELTVHDSTVSVELGDMPAHALRAPLHEWPTLRDSVSYRVLLGVWDAQSPLAPTLPVHALPRTAAGLVRFFEAEQFVAAAQWENAHDAYRVALETDSSCWLCDWRLTEVERWLGLEHDPARVRRYRAHADSFGPLYATLIRAPQMPLTQRLDALQGVTKQWPDVFLGWFQLGDELFHRGPLAGHARAEAMPPLDKAVHLRHDFGPASEHLAWVAITEGDSTAAADALEALDRRGSSHDPYAAGLRAMLDVAFAWRFSPEPVAVATTQRAVDRANAVRADLGAGARMLGSFDVPTGQVALAQILAHSSSRDLRRSGLIAQVLGNVALGRPEQAHDLLTTLTTVAPDPETARFATQLDATIAFTETGARVRLAGPDTATIEARALTDPFSRTVLQLSRAERDAAHGDVEGARRALLWHENTDLSGLPARELQAAEIDWAFGTIARWRLARLLDDGSGSHHGAACTAYRAVVRLWSGGEPRYRARADSARSRAVELHCAPA